MNFNPADLFFRQLDESGDGLGAPKLPEEVLNQIDTLRDAFVTRFWTERHDEVRETLRACGRAGSEDGIVAAKDLIGWAYDEFPDFIRLVETVITVELVEILRFRDVFVSGPPSEAVKDRFAVLFVGDMLISEEAGRLQETSYNLGASLGAILGRRGVVDPDAVDRFVAEVRDI